MTRCWRETASNSSSRRWLTCLHARNFGPRVSSGETLRTSVEGIGFAVKRGDQPVDTLVLQDGAKFGAAGRHLADRAVEIDIRDQPCIAVVPHHVIDIDRLTVRFDDLALHHEASSSWLFSGDLQFLPSVAVKTIGIDCRDVTPEAFDDLLPLTLWQRGPGRANRQAGHRRDVEGPTNNRFQTCETPALPKRAAVFHRAEQRVVETLHRIAPARSSGVPRIGNHSNAEPGRESRGFPRCGFRGDRFTRDLIEDR